jgi:hypothetical protein
MENANLFAESGPENSERIAGSGRIVASEIEHRLL